MQRDKVGGGEWLNVKELKCCSLKIHRILEGNRMICHIHCCKNCHPCSSKSVNPPHISTQRAFTFHLLPYFELPQDSEIKLSYLILVSHPEIFQLY